MEKNSERSGYMMEEGSGKEDFFTPVIQNLGDSELINGRKRHGDSKTRGVQLVVDSDGVIYVNKSSKFDSTKTKRDTVKTPAMQQDDTSHETSNEIDGVGLATLTPEKQEFKKRRKSGIDLNQTPRKKPKKHRPKILDESTKKKTLRGQASKFMPETPSKRSSSKPRSKRSHHKKNSLQQVFDSSKDVVQGHVHNPSCKRALKFNLEKETEAENVCNLSEDCDGQILNLKLDKKEEKQFVKHYQRRRKIKIGDIGGLNMEKPTICATQESTIINAIPESNTIDAASHSSQESQETAQPNQLACEISETDYLTNVTSGCNSSLSFPKLYKRRRNMRRSLKRFCGTVESHRQEKIVMKDCVTSLPSCPLEWRRKRSSGCTKRRIYASRPIKFICSPSPSINLLEHLIDEKHHRKLANKKKDMRKRCNKVKSSQKTEMIKLIKDHLPQECLLQHKDLNVHSSVSFIIDKFKSLSLHQKYGQLMVRDQSVGASIVPYEDRSNSLKKKKKVLVEVDLDEESERAWTQLMAYGGSSSYEQDSEKEEYWDRERQEMRNRAESVVSILGKLQGNRRFSRWKGSVLDSIVGAFLTQNVTDNLSSSAFMFLAARFPVRNLKTSKESLERISACLLLDRFPKEDVGMQISGNRTTFQEIDHCASASKNRSVVICSSTTNNQASEIESFQSKGVPIKDKIEDKENKEHNKDWDNLRKIHSRPRERNDDNMDAIDWESVRQAPLSEVAETIKKRGQHKILAKKIKDYLDRVIRDHGTMDLEWLRDVPPKDAKDYLLGIYGIGLKSTECIRLLTLHHVAFPVDVNVGRVAVRLGWVPLKPLPGGLQMHLLEEYPVLDNIQKYLYPRLCTLSHGTLYELHYQLITFGKVFCTKKKPRCDGCPLSGQCKHFASLSASKMLALPAPEIRNKATTKNSVLRTTKCSNLNVRTEPIAEMPASPENHIEEFELEDIEDFYQDRKTEPIVEMPASPENHIEEFEPEDIEDFYQDRNVALPDLNETPDWHKSGDDFYESNDDIPTIRIDNKAYNNQNEIEISIQGGNKPQDIAVQPGPSSTPISNYRGRLKSVHRVYELPDSHQILQELQVDKRDPNDPSPYLFAPWVLCEEGGKPRHSFSQGCSSLEVCHELACSTLNEEQDYATTISGTLMIPVRSANNGRFPLNGTYFQINEVFADDESTNVPIVVPTPLLSNLPLTFLFCGTTVTSTFKEFPMEVLKGAFNHGYYCNRGFNRKTRCTTELNKLFHIKTNMQGKKTRHTRENKMKQSHGTT